MPISQKGNETKHKKNDKNHKCRLVLNVMESEMEQTSETVIASHENKIGIIEGEAKMSAM